MTPDDELIRAIHERRPWNASLESRLAGIGLGGAAEEGAWRGLIALAGQARFASLYPEFFPSLLARLSECYAPQTALANFERFSETIYDKDYLYSILNGDREFLKALVTLFAGSQVLTDTLLAHPEHFDWLRHPDTLPKSKQRDALFRDFHVMAGERDLSDDTPSLLRRFKRREYVRIGLRDLLGLASMSETVEDLSNLADVCLQAAYEYADRKLKKKHGRPLYQDANGNWKEAEFAILGMGKLGGRELNFSSDIDLIYIYSSSRGETRPEKEDDATAVTVGNHEYFTRIAQIVTKTINDITAEGNVFRVDLDLRPEGKSGEIVNSIASCEVYYQSWGRTWERQALIKARVCAGSEALGEELFAILEPFIYRRHLDFEALEEVRAMKQKIDLTLRRKGIEKGHIKLGFGGIREIEFAVQGHQLLFGGRDRSLRRRGSLQALDALRAAGLFSPQDYEALREAYIFLRNLENRVQISFGMQIYHLPKDETSLTELARKMGFRDSGPRSASARLMDEFDRHTRFVGEFFSGIFEEKKKESAREAAERREAATIPPELAVAHLAGGRFGEPDRVLSLLAELRDGARYTHPSEKSIRDFYQILPRIPAHCARLPEPDAAVERLTRFLEAGGVRESFLDMFSRNDKFLELLLTLFGSGGHLSSILIRRPDLMDVLFNVEGIYRFKPREKIQEELVRLLGGGRGFDEKQLLLRKFKLAEELRIGLRFLLHESDLPGTLADLSRLAEVYLQSAWETAVEGDGPSGLAIVGMGKLGGRELNFGSDLDIVFVYDPALEKESASAENLPAHYAALAQKISRATAEMTEEGYAYKIDTDLRPEGTKGVLTTSLAGYEEYFRDRAAIWERQALTRARFVAGNAEVGRRFMEIAHRFVFGRKLEYAELIEIARLRERMEGELAQEAKKGKNVKLGRGALADIEFTVQILQLMHGGKYPKLRQTNTLDALQALAGSGILDEEMTRHLSRAYLFLRNLECGLRLSNPTAGNHLPQEERELAALARMLKYEAESDAELAQRLSAEYEKITENVRELYRKTVGSLLRTAR